MKILSGLVWPDKGYLPYYCIVREKSPDKEKTFNDDETTLEICSEGVFMKDSLKEFKKHKCQLVYTTLEHQYNSYIRDFIKYKRDQVVDARLRQTNGSSIEASILKIKEYIKDKKIKFNEGSLIKSQLTIFSKETLLEPTPAYAVRSLCMVIGQFDKRNSIRIESEEKNMKSWW